MLTVCRKIGRKLKLAESWICGFWRHERQVAGTERVILQGPRDHNGVLKPSYYHKTLQYVISDQTRSKPAYTRRYLCSSIVMALCESLSIVRVSYVDVK